MSAESGKSGCGQCAGREKKKFNTAFTMAFQPIYDVAAGRVFAHEALVRGQDGAGAAAILGQVTEENRYSFDQACRVRAIELAAGLEMGEHLSINFLPNAVYNPDHCIQTTLWAADRYDFPIERIIFEFTEGEQMLDKAHVKNIVARYKARGFKTAIDDFGAGFAGLGLLADVQPDLVKIDMELIRGMDTDKVRRTIVHHVVRLAEDLGITVIAEGIETPDELAAVTDCGVTLIQGYLLARPQFEALADPGAIRAALSPQRMAG